MSRSRSYFTQPDILPPNMLAVRRHAFNCYASLPLSKLILSFSKDPHQTMVMQHAAMEWGH